MKHLTKHGQPLRSYSSFFRLSSRFLFLAGVILLGWSVYLWTDAHIFETVEAERFNAALKSSVADSGPVSGSEVLKIPRPKVQVGSVLGRIDIPRIGLSVMVLEGSTSLVFRRAAGHLEGTAIPGEKGNIAIAAHRDSFFRPLRNIRDRDLIKFSTSTGSYLYQVESTEIVGPGDVQVLTDSPQPTLTLVTCYPFYYVGPAPKRFIVRARQILSDSGGSALDLASQEDTAPEVAQ